MPDLQKRELSNARAPGADGEVLELSGDYSKVFSGCTALESDTAFADG